MKKRVVKEPYGKPSVPKERIKKAVLKHDPWKNWMGELKFPVPKTELLDRGLAPLIRLMNIPGKLLTTGSCLHDLFIVLYVEDEEWFLKEVVSRIAVFNENRRYHFNVNKTYDFHCSGFDGSKDEYRQEDKYGNKYYWVIRSWTGRLKFVKELTDIFKQVKRCL